MMSRVCLVWSRHTVRLSRMFATPPKSLMTGGTA